MAQSDTIDIGPAVWVQVTNADAASIALQCLGSSVLVKATVGAVAPTTKAGAWLLQPGEGLDGTLAERWPGVVGGTRVYAIAQNFGAQVVSSHA